MDAGIVNGIVTAVLLVAFIGGSIWAFSAKRNPDFDAAARLPLEDDTPGKE
jgi:cytochrome c oxidase cbb3-type subunit IV